MNSEDSRDNAVYMVAIFRQPANPLLGTVL